MNLPAIDREATSKLVGIIRVWNQAKNDFFVAVITSAGRFVSSTKDAKFVANIVRIHSNQSPFVPFEGSTLTCELWKRGC